MNFSSPIKLSSILGIVGLGAIAFVGVPESAKAASIWRGSDYLTTPVNGASYDFGPGIGQVFFTGLPVGPGLTDTIIQRKQDCVLPTIGSSCTIPIEMTQLSLKTSAPVNVGDFNYDVKVTLDPNNASTGNMTIKHQFPDDGGLFAEGTFSSSLNVFFKADFVPVNGGPDLQDVFQSVNLTLARALWSHEPPPGAVLVPGAPGTVVGTNLPPLADQNANDHRGNNLAWVNPDQQGNPVGDFFPGIARHVKPSFGGHIVKTACVPRQRNCTKILVDGGSEEFPLVVPEPSTTAGFILLGFASMFGIKRKNKQQ
jgi:hypothetical protein